MVLSDRDSDNIQVLKKWGGPENVPTLRKFVNSPVPDVKKLSQEAIEAIDARAGGKPGSDPPK